MDTHPLRHLAHLALATLLATAPAHAQRQAVYTDSAGSVTSPTDLWDANSAAISTALSLGTAATTDAAAYATAAQGTLAEGALQPAGDGSALTGLLWGQIGGTPTTLSGYGITDAQPLDADLTSIAAQATTAYGRSLLEPVDAPAARILLGLGNIEDTALSTWPGSTNITTLGTLTSGTVPWSLVASTPTTLTGYGITTGTTGAAVLGAETQEAARTAMDVDQAGTNLPLTGGTISGSIQASGNITSDGNISTQFGNISTEFGNISTLDGNISASDIIAYNNIQALNNLTVQSGATLGDASGDTVQINAGTVTAPNATGTEPNDLANVGTLDGRYVLSATVNNNTVIVTNSTVLTDTPLSIPLKAGRKYVIDVSFSYVTPTNSSGNKFKLNFTGTATSDSATQIQYWTNIGGKTDIGVINIFYEMSKQTNQDANAVVKINTYIAPTADGVLTLQSAQVTAEATPQIIRRNSYIRATQLP